MVKSGLENFILKSYHEGNYYILIHKRDDLYSFSYSWIENKLMDKQLIFMCFFVAAYQVRWPQQSVLQKLQELSHQMEIPELQQQALWHQCPLHQQLPLRQFVLIMHLHHQSWVWKFIFYSFTKCCVLSKGQLNSEWIYEFNISPKMQTKQT